LNGISDESSSSASSGDESPVKENKEESKEKEDEAKNDEQEMVLIQDTGFNVKIVVPGVTEKIELPVSFVV
jgi:hypothetical protein